jgi:hypothetical protein
MGSFDVYCSVNYAGRVLPSGELFIKSQNESGSGGPLKVVAGRGACFLAAEAEEVHALVVGIEKE